MHSGETITDLMNWEEVQKIRKCAKFDAVWNQWEDEMAKKVREFFNEPFQRLSGPEAVSPKPECTGHIEVRNESEGSRVLPFG